MQTGHTANHQSQRRDKNETKERYEHAGRLSTYFHMNFAVGSHGRRVYGIAKATVASAEVLG